MAPVLSLAAALLPAVLSAEPPRLVDVAEAIPDAVVDLRYAGERNFVGRALYPRNARCLLLRPVAERLSRAAARPTGTTDSRILGTRCVCGWDAWCRS